MKVLILSGSPRKRGDGSKIIKSLTEELSERYPDDYQVDYLCDYEIQSCIGCLACKIKPGKACPLQDDLETLLDKMKSATNLVFLTPVYNRMISGQMKIFLDRLSFLLHRPELAGKKALLIATMSYGGASESLRYLKIPVRNMGITVTGSIGILSRAYGKDGVYSQSIDLKIRRMLLKEKKRGLRELIYFNKWKAIVKRQKEHYPGDYQFWHDRGWLERDFYFEGVRVNPLFRKLLPGFFDRVVNKMLSRAGY